jgi:hypothetical protein
VKRDSPPIGETPIVPSMIPMVPPKSPLSSDPSERLAMRVNPRMATQKNSAGPKRMESTASGGARNRRNSTPAMPPMAEEMVAMPIASIALPCLAMG